MTRQDLVIWTLGLLFLVLELAAILFIVHEGRTLLDFCLHLGQERCP